MKLSDYDPRRHPPKTQYVMAGIMIAAFLWCMLACPGSSLPELLFCDMPLHLGAAATICIVIMSIDTLISKGSGAAAEGRLVQAFAEHGFGTETAEILNSRLPQPTEQDKVLRAFHLVMAELYPQAAEQLGEIAADALTQRQKAMLLTARLLLALSVGELPKACKLTEQHQTMLNEIYRNEPEYFGTEYLACADDCSEYLRVSAVFCELMHEPEKAEAYRQQAITRAEYQSAEAAAFCRALTGLQKRYAAGESEAAQALEAELLQSAEEKAASAGDAVNRKRAVLHAKLYAPSRLNVKQYMFGARRLPGEAAPGSETRKSSGHNPE